MLKQTENMKNIEILDKMALELFGEFGFSTCTQEQQNVLTELFIVTQVLKYEN